MKTLQCKIEKLENEGPAEDLRHQIEKEVKENVENQVLVELKSHSTVDYICSLEAQIDRQGKHSRLPNPSAIENSRDT